MSVTTDGFITDIKDLENKLLTLPENERPLLTKYQRLRYELNGTETSLEVKKEGVGIISWSTRGQLGVGSTIKATTGFQASGYSHPEMVTIFKNVMQSDKKEFEFVVKRLRGAKDIYTKGGHVQSIYKDQKFRMYYDNRRQIIEPRTLNGLEKFDVLLDSAPHVDCDNALRARYVSRYPITSKYNKQNSTPSVKTTYKNYLEIGIRNFIKAYVSKEPMFGLTGTEFKSSTDLISFITEFYSSKENYIRGLLKIKLSRQSIWNLKHRSLIWRPIPHTPENMAFTEYVKRRITYFQTADFIKPMYPSTIPTSTISTTIIPLSPTHPRNTFFNKPHPPLAWV